MTQNSFAQTLKSLKLSRDENHFFTTGNAEIDHALSLDNQTLYGNPESDVQQNFAAIVYLNGLFENTCTHFTAIPFGFLYEIDHEGTKSCYVSVEAESKPTSGSFIKFALDNLSEQIETYKQTKNLSKEEIEFCDYVLYQIKNSKNLPLTAIVQNISAALNNSTTLNKFKQNSNQSKQIFNQTNQSNCNENRYTLNLIIENRDEVCRELLGFELIKLQSYIDALGIKLGFDLAELQEPLYVKFDDFGNKTQEQRNADEKSQTAAYITKMQEKFESLQNSINTVVSLQPEDKAQLEKTIERIKYWINPFFRIPPPNIGRRPSGLGTANCRRTNCFVKLIFSRKWVWAVSICIVVPVCPRPTCPTSLWGWSKLVQTTPEKRICCPGSTTKISGLPVSAADTSPKTMPTAKDTSPLLAMKTISPGNLLTSLLASMWCWVRTSV